MKRQIFFIILLASALLVSAKGLRPLVWVLDAGHGGHDQGTQAENVLEKDVNLRIVKELHSLLKKHKSGIKVILTRDDDRYLTLDERCQIANKANADLFLSVHVNYALSNPFLSGTETFYSNIRAAKDAVRAGSLSRTNERSELLAWLVQKNYFDAGRPSNRGAKSYDYYVLQNTDMPAALTEVGFISNHEECLYLSSKKGQREIATMLFNALMEYYTTTQAKTHTETLQRLRRSGGMQSGVVADRLDVRTSREMGQQVATAVREDVVYAASTSSSDANSSIGEVVAYFEPNGKANFSVTQEVADQLEVPDKQELATKPVSKESKPLAEKVKPSSENGKSVEKPSLEKDKSAVKESSAVKEKSADKPSADKPSADKTPADKPSAVKEKSVEKEKTVEKVKSVDPELDPVASAPSPSIPVFSVQVFAVSGELKAGDPKLKGLKPVRFVQSGNMRKVLYGETTDVKQARATLAKVRELFPDAFLVAYLNDQPITIGEAMQLQNP